MCRSGWWFARRQVARDRRGRASTADQVDTAWPRPPDGQRASTADQMDTAWPRPPVDADGVHFIAPAEPGAAARRPRTRPRPCVFVASAPVLPLPTSPRCLHSRRDGHHAPPAVGRCRWRPSGYWLPDAAPARAPLLDTDRCGAPTVLRRFFTATRGAAQPGRPDRRDGHLAGCIAGRARRRPSRRLGRATPRYPPTPDSPAGGADPCQPPPTARTSTADEMDTMRPRRWVEPDDVHLIASTRSARRPDRRDRPHAAEAAGRAR